ncbi:hypothetical protein [Bradyrhizobium elkanii]|uniref:hypothetical protein n=1 Tax=Bradyrhizobium elkanii TaxID=29448 RepID=UPI003D260E85
MNLFDLIRPSSTAPKSNPFDTPVTTPTQSNVRGVQPVTDVFAPMSGSTPAAPKFNPFDATPEGVISNTLNGLPSALVDTVAKFRQGTLSSLESAGMTLTGQEKLDLPQTGFAHNFFTYLYGEHEPQNLQDRIAQTELQIQQSPFAQKHGLDKHALALAFGGIMGDTALNMTPFGGEEGAAGKLLKETSEDGARSILEKMGTDPELAKAFAPKFATASTPEEVNGTLDLLKKVQGAATIKDRLAARADWEQNGQPQFFNLHDQAQETADKLAATRVNSSQYKVLNDRYDSLIKRMVKVKEDWLAKWKIEPDDPRVQETLFKDLPTPTRAADRTPAAVTERPIESSSPTPAESAPAASEKLPPSVGDILEQRPALRDQEAAVREAGAIRPSENIEHDQAMRALEGSIQEKAGSVKNKVNLLDYVRTPEYVLERVGLGKEAKAVRAAYEGYTKELPEQIAKITGWFDRVKDSPDAPQRLFRYLDGQPGIKLSTEERNVAEEMQAYLRAWADRLKIPHEKRIASYITHIFDHDLVQKEFDPDLAKIIADQIPGSVYDPFLEKRLGAKGFIEDAFLALDAYTKRAVRKAHMDPALEGLENAANRAEIETYKYVQRYASRVNMRPTETENLLDNLIKSTKIGYKFGQRPVANISRTVRQIVYRGTLGLNIGSAVRNLTQGVNTYAKLGEKYTVIGYTKLLTKMAGGDLEELYKTGVLNQDLVQDRQIGVYKRGLQKLDKSLFTFFEFAEKINRGAAYFGAKSKALAAGKSEQTAIEYAKRVVRETQFSFSAIDTPVALNDDIVKLLTQLQSYNVKQFEFLGGMAKQKEFAGIARYIGGSIAMLYTIGSLVGMKPQDLIPSVRVGGGPIPSFLGAGWDAATARNTRDRQDAMKKVKSGVWSVIPAGSQIRKTLQGASAAMKGRSTTPTGRTRYEVNDPESVLRALLFGPNNLPQAQDYFNSLDGGGSKGNAFSQ